MNAVDVQSIDFSCPHCGTETNVDVAYAGKTGPCSACGKSISIPTAFEAGKQQTKAKSRSKRFHAPVLVMTLLFAGGAFLLMVLVGLIVVTVVVPSAKKARARATQTICNSNLQQISSALQAYHQEHGTFPPAVVYDEKGVAMHSWRVLLLPYFGQEGSWIHQNYDLTKPWNSPENLRFTRMMPSFYSCPNDARATGGETSYVAIVGIGTVFEKDKKVTLDDIINGDGLESTLLVVEAHGSAIGWTEPKDADISMLANGINSNVKGAIRGNHAGEVHAISADGNVQVLDDSVTFDELTAMGTYHDDRTGLGTEQ